MTEKKLSFGVIREARAVVLQIATGKRVTSFTADAETFYRSATEAAFEAGGITAAERDLLDTYRAAVAKRKEYDEHRSKSTGHSDAANRAWQELTPMVHHIQELWHGSADNRPEVQ